MTALSKFCATLLLCAGGLLLALVPTVAADDNAQIRSDNEPANQPAPLRMAVITHGFRAAGGANHPTDWTAHLRSALEKSNDEVVVFDWTDESNDAAPGWAEAAGDELFARIIGTWLRTGRPIDLHLIGHSRGAVVNSEAHRRLYWYASQFDSLRNVTRRIRVTMLDPHPANGRAGMSQATSLEAAFLASVTQDFEVLTADPDPVIWPNATYAESFYQRTAIEDLANDWPQLNGADERSAFAVAARMSLQMNLFGAGAEASFAKQLDSGTNLTGTRFTWNNNDRKFGPFLCSHTNIGYWYALRSENRPQDSQIENHRNPDAHAHRLANGAAAECEPIFNGDFRHHGRIENEALKIFQEKASIPGWQTGAAFEVTPAGQLRLVIGEENSDSPHMAAVTHNPMFIPAECSRLTFDASGVLTGETDPMPTLGVYMIPVVRGENNAFRLDTNRAAWKELASWKLRSDRLEGTQSHEMDLPALGSDIRLGGVGAIRLEFSAPSTIGAVFEIDNFRLLRAK